MIEVGLSDGHTMLYEFHIKEANQFLVGSSPVGITLIVFSYFVGGVSKVQLSENLLYQDIGKKTLASLHATIILINLDYYYYLFIFYLLIFIVSDMCHNIYNI